MPCSANQTSTILDCICINGHTLIEYVDEGDQTLQALITAIQATLTMLQACCTSNTTAIATINGLLTTLQGEISALQTCCTTNTAAITILQGAVTALQDAVTTLQATAHPALTLTKNQDVAGAPGARATLNVARQVLNLPPAIAARILSSALTVTLNNTTITQITGLGADFDTVGAMAQSDRIVIPRTGRYNISAGWSNNSPPACPDYVLVASLGINGAWAGRYTAPGSPITADQVALTLPGHLLQAGDVLTLGGLSDCAGVVITGAYLAAEYIEGT